MRIKTVDLEGHIIAEELGQESENNEDKYKDRMDISTTLKELGIEEINEGTSTGQAWLSNTEFISSYSPIDGKLIGKVSVTTPGDYEKVIRTAEDAFKVWRHMPAPKRGEIVRLFGEKLRENKEALGMLVTYEMGKSLPRGIGRSSRDD